MDWTLIVQTVTASAVALVLIAAVVALILWLRHTRRLDATLQRLIEGNAALLEASARQGERAEALAEEAHEDHAFAMRPLLILIDEPPLGIRDQPWAAVRVRNVGNGPALTFVVWMLSGGSLYRSAGAEFEWFLRSASSGAGRHLRARTLPEHALRRQGARISRPWLGGGRRCSGGQPDRVLRRPLRQPLSIQPAHRGSPRGVGAGRGRAGLGRRMGSSTLPQRSHRSAQPIRH